MVTVADAKSGVRAVVVVGGISGGRSEHWCWGLYLQMLFRGESNLWPQI